MAPEYTAHGGIQSNGDAQGDGEAGKTYWLVALTGTTWPEFRRAGAEITGLRGSRRALAAKIKPGDVLTCCLTGVRRWVGALEVIEPTDAGGLHRGRSRSLTVSRGERRAVRR